MEVLQNLSPFLLKMMGFDNPHTWQFCELWPFWDGEFTCWWPPIWREIKRQEWNYPGILVLISWTEWGKENPSKTLRFEKFLDNSHLSTRFFLNLHIWSKPLTVLVLMRLISLFTPGVLVWNSCGIAVYVPTMGGNDAWQVFVWLSQWLTGFNFLGVTDLGKIMFRLSFHSPKWLNKLLREDEMNFRWRAG